MSEHVTIGAGYEESVHVNGTSWRPRRRRRLYSWWERAVMSLLVLNVSLVLVTLPVALLWGLIQLVDGALRVLGSWR